MRGAVNGSPGTGPQLDSYSELFLTVTEILAVNPDVETAVPEVVAVVGREMGWDLGVVWLRNDEDHLSCQTVWSSDEEAAARFRQASSGVTLARGESLAGGAWESSEPAWFEDVLAESDYAQVKAAASAGMRAAVCIPLQAGVEATGVLEYFASRLAPTDAEIARMLIAVGSQLGQFIERKRAEAEARRALAELRRSNEDLEQFAYAASHDLFEPLRAISGFGELLSERYGEALDERGREMIEHIVSASSRGERLVADLLAFSRVGSAGLKLEPVPLAEVVADAEQQLDTVIAERRARIEYDATRLPWVEGDRDQLVRLLQNLIANGIKFNERGEPTVRISAGPQDDWTLVAVHDDGIGIPPTDAARIFEAFARGQARGRYPGTGIGLAMCERIVARHGGRLWVESPPTGGSVFCFTVRTASE
jgi:signal transduction histidine kinase